MIRINTIIPGLKGMIISILIVAAYYYGYNSKMVTTKNGYNRKMVTTKNGYNGNHLRTLHGRFPNKNMNIVFIKTHKTGSSTLTNIFNRYAYLNNLNMVIPKIGSHFKMLVRFHKNYSREVLPQSGKRKILANHAVYDRPQLDLTMGPNTKYVTIIREPVAQFESAFHFFHLERKFNLVNNNETVTITDFFKDFWKYEEKFGKKSIWKLIHNTFWNDIGGTSEDVPTYIKKLDKEFDLVLITEYFDVSLVLMMKELSMNLEDIIYLKLKKRTESHREKNLPDIVKETIKRWSSKDVLLYNHFNKTFWKRVATYGEKIWEDVRKFKAKTNEFQRKCALQGVKGMLQQTLERYKSFAKGDDKKLCTLHLTDDEDFLKIFRKM